MKSERKIRPPKLADRLFDWYCANASMDDLHGDREELLYAELLKMPAGNAILRYWQLVL